MTPARARTLLLCCLLWLTGCGVEPPGTLLGEYDMRGSLLENTCGSAAFPARDPLVFQVQLRDDAGRALWLLNPPARPGTLEADGEFSFEVANIYPVNQDGPPEPVDPFVADPGVFVEEASLEMFDPAQQGPACTLTLTERLWGTVYRDLHRAYDVELDVTDEAAEDRSARSSDIIADNEIDIRATSGSDCSILMADNGGPFEALPCLARYEITGTLIEPDE